MYTLVQCLPYCYIRFRVAGKGSQPNGQNFAPTEDDVNITAYDQRRFRV